MTCLLVFLRGYVCRLWYEYDGPPKSSKNFRRLKFFFLGKEISRVEYKLVFQTNERGLTKI